MKNIVVLKLLATLLHILGMFVLGGSFFVLMGCGFYASSDSFDYLVMCRIMPWLIIILLIVNFVTLIIVPFLSLSSKTILKYILWYLAIIILFGLFFAWAGEGFKLPFIDMLWRQRVY